MFVDLVRSRIMDEDTVSSLAVLVLVVVECHGVPVLALNCSIWGKDAY